MRAKLIVEEPTGGSNVTKAAAEMPSKGVTAVSS